MCNMCNTHQKQTPIFPPEIKLTTLSHMEIGMYTRMIKTENTVDLFVIYN